jgi:Glu-tRNA(Gln) amidotransferase subunit E-like FAD-binding protein
MAFELKYKEKDTQNLVDIFATLSESNINQETIKTLLEKLTKYPTDVIEEFLECVNLLKEDDINEDRYMGIIGYITLRLNLVGLISK